MPCRTPPRSWRISSNTTATTSSGIRAIPALTSRYLCCGHAFVVVGKASQPFFVNAETGLLGQFRHQYFLVNLIAHFQKAALMLFSEWLVVAISQLDVRDTDSVRDFKREIRRIMATFLRFTERYWFHEVSNQAQVRDLFRLLTSISTPTGFIRMSARRSRT
jgi:hypothetical protein